jgi:hypothetical protein
MRGILGVCWILWLAVAPVAAVDYDKVERKLTREPAYQSKKPRYALLLFGPQARLRVWVVLDGETVYLDRNGDGDLTGAGERFAKEADAKNVEILDPDGKTRYVLTSVVTDSTLYTPQARRERAAKGIPPTLMVNVTVKGPIEYQQYCDIQEMRDDPRQAQVAHFHGPLAVGPRTINWKLPPGLALQTGAEAPDLYAVVGTMSARHGCWVVVRTHEGDKCAFPKGVRPVAEVEFPAKTPGRPPVKRKYELNQFC